jgi:inosine-uridine nucleoside N-ribohydrolase
VVVGHALRNLVDGVHGPKDPAHLHTEELLREAADGLHVERLEEVLRPDDGGTVVELVLVARAQARHYGRPVTLPSSLPAAAGPALLERLIAPPTGGVLDVVIDTDATNEVDDQLALVWAMLRPDRLNLLAMHACPWAHGEELLTEPAFLTEVDRADLAAMGVRASSIRTVTAAEGVERAAAECRRIAALVGVDVPTVDGAREVMRDPQTPVRSDAVDSLIALAHQDREGPLHVLAIGAATNVSSAVLVDPSIRERIAVVWTAAYPSFWPHPNASFNMAQDLHASRVLFESGVPLVYLPGYYVGEHLRISLPELEAHVRGTGPVGDDLYELCTASRYLTDVRAARR